MNLPISSSKLPSIASVWPSSVDSPQPYDPSSEVTLTKSHRGRTRKYSIVLILAIVMYICDGSFSKTMSTEKTNAGGYIRCK